MTRTPRIFICYRREDTSGHTGRLADHLRSQFGEDNVFQDVYTISMGDDFRAAVRTWIDKSDVVLAIIGRDWLNATGPTGRRLDDPADWVRVEISEALNRRVPIVPVLVRGAVLPQAEQLPDDLAPLAHRAKALCLATSSGA
jgi:hypothetical protein